MAIPSVLKDFLGHIKLSLISEVSYAAWPRPDFSGIGAKSAGSRNNYSEFFCHFIYWNSPKRSNP